MYGLVLERSTVVFATRVTFFVRNRLGQIPIKCPDAHRYIMKLRQKVHYRVIFVSVGFIGFPLSTFKFHPHFLFIFCFSLSFLQ